MKLIVLFSVVALVACDYSAPKPEKPTDAYAPPDKIEPIDETSASLEPGKSLLKLSSFYKGSFPTLRYPYTSFFPSTFSSFPSIYSYPIKTLSPQGLFPPISQVIPPQFSQVVPPFFGTAKPVLPAPTPVLPPVFPPTISPLLSRYTFPYYRYPYFLPSAFPSSFSFPPSTLFPEFPKQPSKTQTESLSTSYGPPVSGPVEPEPAGQAESSAAFEPTPVTYPYEAAAPEEPEQAAPHAPAQEYGPPALK